MREFYQNKYKYLLVDEYQDSNLIQEAILNSVSTCRSGRYNIFMVGDVSRVFTDSVCRDRNYFWKVLYI